MELFQPNRAVISAVPGGLPLLRLLIRGLYKASGIFQPVSCDFLHEQRNDRRLFRCRLIFLAGAVLQRSHLFDGHDRVAEMRVGPGRVDIASTSGRPMAYCRAFRRPL